MNNTPRERFDAVIKRHQRKASTESFTRKDFHTIIACSTVLTALAIIGATMAGIL